VVFSCPLLLTHRLAGRWDKDCPTECTVFSFSSWTVRVLRQRHVEWTRIHHFPHSRAQQIIGHLEDYWTSLPDGFFTTDAGNRMVPESTQAIGSENWQTFRLASDLEINRSFSKKIRKAGTLVRPMVSPLGGNLVRAIPSHPSRCPTPRLRWRRARWTVARRESLALRRTGGYQRLPKLALFDAFAPHWLGLEEARRKPVTPFI
jgi:hypothetical protein